MNKSEIVTIINNFLVEDFEIEEDKLQAQAAIKDALDLDSLDYVDLVVSIEKNFGFKVKPDDFQTMKTLDDFYEYVTNRVASLNM
ncbi:MAG: acyl carrier protein [Chitinophagaceae bacterium]